MIRSSQISNLPSAIKRSVEVGIRRAGRCFRSLRGPSDYDWQILGRPQIGHPLSSVAWKLAEHATPAADLGPQVFFCPLHSPWERATCESQNDPIRHYRPRAPTSPKFLINRLAPTRKCLTSAPERSSAGVLLRSAALKLTLECAVLWSLVLQSLGSPVSQFCRFVHFLLIRLPPSGFWRPTALLLQRATACSVELAPTPWHKALPRFQLRLEAYL
jgi:hypothetical protein